MTARKRNRILWEPFALAAIASLAGFGVPAHAQQVVKDPNLANMRDREKVTIAVDNVDGLDAATLLPIVRGHNDIIAQTRGYYTDADGGGNRYIYRATGRSGITANGVTLINGPGSDDYWEAVDQTTLTARQCGAKGNGSDDDYARLQAGLTAATGKTFIIDAPASYYKLTDTLSVPAGTTVRGLGFSSKVQQTVREKNVFTIAGDNVTIDGVHCIGDNGTTGVGADLNCGVYSNGHDNLRVVNCFIEKCEGSGVQVRSGLNVTIIGNYCFQNPYGSSSSTADILFYSASGSNRHIISGNFCLSNNSQGIYYNSLGGDADSTIANNVCVTLDSDLSESASGGTRRHGIVAGYNGGNQSRIVISGNICRNTKWTGIYLQSASGTSGPFLCTGNLCSNNGYDTTTTLSGGIYLTATGGEVISDNVCLDFQNSAQYLTGGITVNTSSANTLPVLIDGNVIRDSTTSGIAIGTQAALLKITNNVIISPVGNGILADHTGSVAGVGGHTIEGNLVWRDSGDNASCVWLDMHESTRRTLVARNYLRNSDTANNSATNAGVAFLRIGTVDVVGNRIENTYYGISARTYHANSTRYFSTPYIDDNDFRDCIVGVGIATTTATNTTVPLCGNTFSNVTTKTSGANLSGFAAGIICTRDGVKLVTETTSAAPTAGTWAVGDRCYYTTPTATGHAGAVCTSAGTPGTWTSFSPIGVPTTITAYSAGTVYSLTNTAAAVDFGTTDPAVTITEAGTWEITFGWKPTYTGATVASETATFKLRRTNNTAADLTASSVTIDLPEATTLTHDLGVYTRTVIYTTSNTDDAVAMFGNVSAALVAGTVDVTDAWIVARRLK